MLNNRYSVIEEIGKGGMGAVYKAEDRLFENVVALKQNLIESDQLRKAFEREARLLACLRHPGLPRVTDYFADGEKQYLAMDDIQGEDLGNKLQRRGKGFELSEVILWADQILSVLDYLHRQPIVHRDIKPQNIKLSDANEIILLDFGLAKGSPSGSTSDSTIKSTLGFTPTYAPLEQIDGSGTDARSDLYSLAATMYHLLTGVTPADVVTRARMVLSGGPDPLSSATVINANIPPELADALKAAMSMNPGERPASAAAFREQLQSIQQKTQKFDLPVLRRAQRMFDILTGATILWVDDRPENNHHFVRLFESFGMKVETAITSGQALNVLAGKSYDLVISDIERFGNYRAGLEFLDSLRNVGRKPDLIFFTGRVDRDKPIPLGAFGIADNFEQLFHLVLDVLERTRL